MSFRWQERLYRVVSVGRSWDEAGARHILVMCPGEKVYELVFDRSEGAWYLKTPVGPQTRVL